VKGNGPGCVASPEQPRKKVPVDTERLIEKRGLEVIAKDPRGTFRFEGKA